MTTIIAYFKVADHDRRTIENELMNATFPDMNSFLGLCEDEGWELQKCETLAELCFGLNDEYYPTDSWVVYINIQNYK